VRNQARNFDFFELWDKILVQIQYSIARRE
jgi:hypothetical protein